MQFRLVLHSPVFGPALPGSGDDALPLPSHGDLFIKNGEVLVTYEWPYADLPEARDKRYSHLLTGAGGILLTRKEDHRLHYWTHEGEVSKGRGTVAELLRGEIEIAAEFPHELRVRPGGPS